MLRRYREGSLTAQEVGAALVSLLAEAEAEAEAEAGVARPRARTLGALRAATMEVRVGRLRGPRCPCGACWPPAT
ncbi:hypothetical protein K5549_021871 [Capra hircus]|nr:hypothetical protein K5549_021871 [Capra hircus]